MTALIEQNEALSRKPMFSQAPFRMHNGKYSLCPSPAIYKGAAASRHSPVVSDELWGFETEKARRLYEELTPPPSKFSAWALIVTYAGFTGESDRLQSIYDSSAGRIHFILWVEL
jgi:uncharacterized protein CbrC (UPF0167 family)